jgi:hypothetical protein
MSKRVLRKPRAALVGVLAVSGCFSEDATLGAECSSDEGCGEGQSCEGGICVEGDGGTDSAGTTSGDTSPATGCDEIDVLFVVDNSSSMSEEQDKLMASFTEFVKAIRLIQTNPDFHFMVVASDEGKGYDTTWDCPDGECWCSPAPACCEQACEPGFTCLTYDCGDLPVTECDTTWGAGQTHAEDGTSCGLAEGHRYLRDDQPNLYTTFYCVADVGTYGSGDELPMLAMTDAVSDALNGAGGCNEGFLRADAVLAVVLIADEDDDNPLPPIGPRAYGSPGNPEDWAEALVTAKHGNSDAVAVLGLLGDSDVEGGLCAPGADPGAGDDGAAPAPRLSSTSRS